MNKVEGFFAKILLLRWYIVLLFTIILVAGSYSLLHIKIDAIPDITNKQVVINTKTGAMDPIRVEKAVTYLAESEMYGIQGLEEMRSLTKFGLSQVILIFKDNTDIYFAREQVLQRLSNLRNSLPQGVSPNIAPLTTGVGEILMYRVYSTKKDNSQYETLSMLRTIQQFNFARELKKVKGVAEVDTIGGYARELHLNIKPEVLARYGMNLAKLEVQLATLGESYGGGYIEKDGKQSIIRTNPSINSYADIMEIPIKIDYTGNPIPIKNIVEIRQDYSQRLGAATYGNQEAVIGTVMLRSGENAKQVLIQVQKAIEEINKKSNDVKIEILYNRDFLIASTIHTVAKNLLEGILLVVAILCLIIGGFKVGLMVALALPFCALILAICMKIFGISANLMSLGAIDFGLLVDPSVVVMEYLIAHLAFASQKEKGQNIAKLISQMAKPVFFGMLIIILVYIPITMFSGIEGKTFRPMAINVIISLCASIITAFVLMPVLAYFFLGSAAHKQSKIIAIICSGYSNLLDTVFLHAKKILAICIMFFAWSIFLFFKMPSDFLPNLNEGDAIFTIAMNDGTSLSRTIDVTKEVSNIIKEDSRVEKVFSRIGTAESGLDPAPQSVSDVFIILKNESKSMAVQISSEIYQKIKNICNDCDISETQPIKMRFNEMLQGSRADLSLKIFGDNLETLMDITQKVRILLGKDSQIKSVEQDLLNSIKLGNTVDITPNYFKIAKHQVGISDINTNVANTMGGLTVGNFYAFEFPIAIVVHMNEGNRNKIDSIKQVPISLMDGGSFPLEQIATIEEKQGIVSIPRLFGKRYAALSVYLNDTNYLNFINKSEKIIRDSKIIPEGYTLEWGGKFNNMQSAKKQILLIVPIIFLAIIFVLYKVFHNIKQVAIVISSVPFAISGGIIMLYVFNVPITISAYIGFIVLTGIGLLNSIILVDTIAKANSVKNACISRLRPILMTALVASLGFIPMALGHGMGAEVQQPIAITVIGGIISSTIATLVINPVLFEIFSHKEA